MCVFTSDERDDIGEKPQMFAVRDEVNSYTGRMSTDTL